MLQLFVVFFLVRVAWCCHMRANIDQTRLDFFELNIMAVCWSLSLLFSYHLSVVMASQTKMRVQFVDAAKGLENGVVFAKSVASEKHSGASVTSFSVDFKALRHLSSLNESEKRLARDSSTKVKHFQNLI